MSRLLEVVVIVLLWSSLCTETKASELYHVYIDDASGNDSTECLNSNSTLKPCKTLSYVAENLNWTKAAVTVLSDRLNLTLPVEFKHLQQLVISGNHSTILSCSETNAGLAFVGVENFSIHSLSIKRCGAERNSTNVDLKKNQTENVSVAVYILNCTGVAIHDVDIVSSNGRGLSIYDTNGAVSITNCVFSDNYVDKSSQGGGGGLYIEFTFCSPGTVSNCYDRRGVTNSMYNIANCTFENNKAYLITERKIFVSPTNPLSVPKIGKGGGLFISIGSDATNNTFLIVNCTFYNNSATLWGSGMLAELLNSAANTNISVSDTKFTENYAEDFYCETLVFGLMFYNQTLMPGKVPQNNSFSCNCCSFEGNRGGGLIIVASKDRIYPSRYGTIEFSSSNWINNTSPMGAAVFITPAIWDYSDKGCLPIPKFINCTFENNSALESESYFAKGFNIRVTSLGHGTVVVNEFDILFEGNLLFRHNKGTAVQISDGKLVFCEGSVVNFHNNTAERGGAIAMYGSSVLQFNNNSVFLFIGNKARQMGGAIYVEFNVQFVPEYHNCFLQFRSQGCIKSNTTFNFKGNNAGVSGNSIFATTFMGCMYLCDVPKNTTPKSILQYFAEFNFDESSSLATLPASFKLSSPSVQMIPGAEYHLPLTVQDESGGNLTGIMYEASVNSTQNVSIDAAFHQVSNNTIVMLGAPNDTADLHLLASGSNLVLSVDVTFANCQPGYIFNGSKCVCGATDYLGLVGCDPGVKIKHGYWIGFCSDTTQTKLCTTFCPPGFCSYHHMSPSEDLHPLPYNTSLLDSYICGPTRTGRLCGKCVQNHSVYFHSEKYQCGEERLCYLGWLFYLLSEVVPLVFLFLVVLYLNISFTDGNVNCFVLYAQILNFLLIDDNDAIKSNRFIKVIHLMLKFIYRPFNLNFFTVEQLSFCLWKGATVLDVMTMKATTVGLALVLVLLTLLLARCRCAPFRMLFTRLKTPQSVLIHGLSAFIVLCYSQCAKLVFHILTFVCLYTTNSHCKAKIVYLNGNINYFEGAHINYAVVALLALIFLIIIPPLLLLLYPLVFKCLGLCKQSESKISTFLWRLMPIQILDAFQSSFKNKYRFFAGLYFLYRAIILAAYAYSGTVFQFYSAVQLQLILVLAVHAIIQPHKNRKHNMVDALLFTNLTVINAITLFNYTMHDYTQLFLSRVLVNIMIYIRALLIFLPFVYFTISGVMGLIQKRRGKKCAGSNELPPLRSGEHSLLLSK